MSIRIVQERLRAAGFDPGPVDGVWGRKTEAALDKALGLTSGRLISDKGVAHIKASEGLVLTAYADPGSGGEPWTIGYGHTGGVRRGDRVTQAEAEAMLLADLERFEAAVNRLAPRTAQGQFDALVSFAFNVGEKALADSTLLRFHNAGDYAGAKAQFVRWTYASGKQLPGLITRRALEAALYAS